MPDELTAIPVCEYLDWDSEFFGFHIGRINRSYLTPDLLKEINSWSVQNSIECLYFLANLDKPDSLYLSEISGFHLVEIRITYDYHLENWDPERYPADGQNLVVRAFEEPDLPQMQEIARDSYENSRFYFDDRFSKSMCQKYYQTWIKKSSQGGAEMVLVAEADERILGYITGNIDSPGEGQLELTAVDSRYRRKGVGQTLFRNALTWYINHGTRRITVATQGRNVTTQRMIEKHGFLKESVQPYFHKWYS
jgi:ribosomal protein S18 acetylase RimI-like enzyme